MKKIILTFIVNFITLFGVAQTNYYVSNSGNNSNNGSINAPFLDIQNALWIATAGDNIYLRAGTYAEKLAWTNSGTAGNPITLSNYNNEVVTISGVSATNASQAALIQINSKSYIRISGIKFADNIMSNADGINVQGSGTDIEITNCEFSNIGWTSIKSTMPTPNDNAHAIVFIGTTLNSYNDILVSNNNIHDCITGYSESLTMVGNVENFTIENNSLQYNTNIGIDAAGHFSWTGAPENVNYARNGSIKNNTVSDFDGPTALDAAGGIYVDGGSNITIENNTVFNYKVGFSIGCEVSGKSNQDNIVQNNIAYNCSLSGLFLGSNTTSVVNDTKVYNNTFYKCGTGVFDNGQIALQNNSGSDIRNNIMQPTNNRYAMMQLVGTTSTSLSINYNQFWRDNTSTTNLFFGITGDQNSLLSNPLFEDSSNNDFHLTSSSSSIDAGDPTYTPSSNVLDMDNQTRIVGGRVDIGADEFSTVIPDLTSMTISDDGTNLEILLQGVGIATDYDVFIDIDNNATTGYTDGGNISGADFYIDEFGIYSYNGVTPAWGWSVITGLTNTVVSGVSHKFTIAKSSLGLSSSGITTNTLFQNNGTATELLPASGMQSHTTMSGINLETISFSDDVNLYVTIAGNGIGNSYDLFIDTDNNAATGYTISGIGADFLIQNGSFFSNIDNTFNWTPIVTGYTITDETGTREFKIDRTTLGITDLGLVIDALYQNTEAFVPTDVLPVQSYTTTSTVTTTSWTGTTNELWNLAGNWNNGIPTSSSLVTIPDVSTAPKIDETINAVAGNLTITESEGLTINSGGSLIVSGTSSGTINYNRSIEKHQNSNYAWYAVSSPVSSITLTTLTSNNNFALGSGGNRIGIATYNNNGSSWNYFTTASTDAIVSGTGLIAKLDNTTGGNDLIFSGNYTKGPVEIDISQGVNNLNFIGNPYTSYINLGTFFTENEAANRFSETTIWLWDENKNGTNMGGYVQKLSGLDADFQIAPGQGFFISSGTANSNLVVFSATNQSHQSDSFLKSYSNRIEIDLKIVLDDDMQHQTKLYYLEGATTGFDNGYDGSLFEDVSYDLAIYSKLVSNKESNKLGVQSLPNSNYENMVVPIGITTKANKEITFSLKALNLPSNLNIFLEDRHTNTFTQLDTQNSTYKFTSDEDFDNIGRFYLHTTPSILNIEQNNINKEISLYPNPTSGVVYVKDISNYTYQVYNIIGQVIQSNKNTLNSIDISSQKNGIYFVKLTVKTTLKEYYTKIIKQ